MNMKMHTMRSFDQTEYDVILGLCPGCQLWQVDYTDVVALDYMFLTEDSLSVDQTLWHEVVEDVLREHLEECTHLQLIIADI